MYARNYNWNLKGEHIMTSVFNLCKLLIQKGRTDGLQDKMDVYLAADRLTTEEYNELTAMLTTKTTEEK